MNRFSSRLSLALVIAFAFPAAGQEVPKGQRVYFSGHSFHYFMPPILTDIAKKAKIEDHAPLGLSAIGGSRVYQHWAPAATTIAKDAGEIKLPADVIKVTSTNRFPASGELVIDGAEGETTIAYTGKTNNSFTGCKGGKGAVGPGKKVTAKTNEVREMLKAGKVDVFTMAPIYLPDEGIENFLKLAIEGNPKVRVFIQQSWLPFDNFALEFKAPAKVDHNAPTVEELRKAHNEYFRHLSEHVAELNKKSNTNALRVAPIGQAVVKLREKIIAGEVPGLKQQDDLFTDAIGHAKPPLQALVAYCYYALIYEKSPVGLPVPAVLASAKEPEKLNRLLQEIAWEIMSGK
jgi:hypothetical protein